MKMKHVVMVSLCFAYSVTAFGATTEISCKTYDNEKKAIGEYRFFPEDKSMQYIDYIGPGVTFDSEMKVSRNGMSSYIFEGRLYHDDGPARSVYTLSHSSKGFELILNGDQSKHECRHFVEIK